MNLLSDAASNETSIQFADATLKDRVTTTLDKVVYSPIYAYDVNYDKTNGYFNFTRAGGGSTGSTLPLESYNPAVLAAPVAAQLGGYLTQLNSYDEAKYGYVYVDDKITKTNFKEYE